MEQEKFDIKKVKVCRTLEGTISEIVAAIILVITWALAIAIDRDVVEGHYLGALFGSIAVVYSLVCAYFPSQINVANVRLENIRQVDLAIRMTRVLAIELALLLLAMVSFREEITDGLWMLIPVGVILLTAIIFTLIIRKAK